MDEELTRLIALLKTEELRLGVDLDQAEEEPILEFEEDRSENRLMTPNGEVLERCERCRSHDVVISEGFIQCNECQHTTTFIQYDYGQDYFSMRDTNNRRNTARCSIPRAQLNPRPFLMMAGNGRTTVERTHRAMCNNYHDKILDKLCRYLCMAAGNLPRRVLDQACGYVHRIFGTEGNGCARRANKRRGLLAACLVFSLNHHKAPYNIQEIGRIMGVNASHVLRGCHLFMQILPEARSVRQFHTPRPSDFVQRWSSELVRTCPKLSDPTRFNEAFADGLAQAARNVLERVEAHIVDHRPETLAAGVLWWILLKRNIPESTQLEPRDLSAVTDISRNALNNVRKKLDELITLQT